MFEFYCFDMIVSFVKISLEEHKEPTNGKAQNVKMMNIKC